MTSHHVEHLLGCPDPCISSPLKLCMYLTNHNKLFYTSLPVTGFVFVIFFPEQVQFQTETDETFVGKDDTLLVNDHETHSSVSTQEEVVTWNMKAPWGRIAVNMVYYT